jgi:hypothetical protein
MHGTFFIIIFLRWGETESTWYVGHYSALDDDDDDDECGAVGGMRIGRGTEVLV